MTTTTARRVPLILASALFMQNLDSTALATSLPQVAESLGQPLLSAHILITSYMLSLALFLPLSGWVADRFGPRRIFVLAIGIFTFASLLCGLAGSFEFLIACRVLQGLGGALMVPVARLLLVRVVPKSELVAAIALTGIPAIIGPIVGPLVGGTIATWLSWRWIFFLNIPVGIVAIWLILRMVPAITVENPPRFDWLGFLLSAWGLTGSLFALDTVASDAPFNLTTALILTTGLISLGFYGWHALHTKHPLFDVRLLRHATFRASVLGGSLFRIGVGAYPFLMPLMLQAGFGFSAAKAGVFTCLAALGSLGMRSISIKVLGRIGYRTTLVWCGLLASLSLMASGFFSSTTPAVIMAFIIMVGGIFRSLQFTVLNTIVFAETSQSEASHANTFSQMAQRISLTLGVTIGALTLHHGHIEGTPISPLAFTSAFLVVGVFMLMSVPLFYRLNPLSTAQIDIASKRKSSPKTDTLAE